MSQKCNQELEKELLKLDPSGSPVTPLALSTATDVLNSRIRHQGLSAKEIVFGRDQFTGTKLVVDGNEISDRQDKMRKRNHDPSAYSKSSSKKKAVDADVKIGDLVFIKSEGSKHKPRERYIIINIAGRKATLQKMNATKFCSRKYEVDLNKIFPVVTNHEGYCDTPNYVDDNESDTSVDEIDGHSSVQGDEDPVTEGSEEEDEEVSADEDVSDTNSGGRPVRNRREPAWLRDPQWVRE